MDEFCILVKTVAQTETVAQAMAQHLLPGDTVILSGGLASGKTHFVKALAQALGSTDCVTSPTYTIANFYDTIHGKMLHMDVYRLSGIPEFLDLGLQDFCDESITVIEWGEIVAQAFASYLSIEFAAVDSSDTSRTLTFSCVGERWNARFTSLRNDFPQLL